MHIPKISASSPGLPSLVTGLNDSQLEHNSIARKELIWVIERQTAKRQSLP